MRRMALIMGLLATMVFPAAAQSPQAEPIAAPASNARWARDAVAALPRATTVNDHDGNKLFDELDAAYKAVPPSRLLPAIVSFREGVSTGEGLARIRRILPNTSVTRRFEIIPAYAGNLTREAALAIAQLPEVRQIELDSRGQPELDSATAIMGADAVIERLGISGSGDAELQRITPADIGIAILDSGFAGSHVDLAHGKIRHFLDLGGGQPRPYDPAGHGTHVASIAAGWGRGESKYRGVAPGAAVIGIKIDGANESTESLALKGWEWIVRNRAAHNIRVATNSYGFGRATDGTSALERAVDKVWDAGVVCFKSAGNSGPERGTMTIPGAARGILAMGSVLDPPGEPASPPFEGSYGFRLSYYSSRGPTTDGRIKPDLVAPGQAITAAQHSSPDGYVTFSGTSMAAPFAAGTAALVIAADPSLTPEGVRRILYDTAEDWGTQGPDIDHGHGRIQVWDAVATALERSGGHAGPRPSLGVPKHHVRAGTTDNTGLANGTFTVSRDEKPVAVTVLAEGLIVEVEVFDSEGLPLAILTPGRVETLGLRLAGYLWQRHAWFSFVPPERGTYSYRIEAAPLTPFVIDISHSA